MLSGTVLQLSLLFFAKKFCRQIYIVSNYIGTWQPFYATDFMKIERIPT